jgi:hypothetical protein
MQRFLQYNGTGHGRIVKTPDADIRNVASFSDGLGSENSQTLKFTAHGFEED